MKEYELIHEIKNLCRNNQMRDVFFQEVACEDPVAYIRGKYADKQFQYEAQYSASGAVTIHAVVDGLIQKFVFTPI